MSTAPQLNKTEKSVKDLTEKLIKKLPKINNKTRKRAPLDKLQHPNFIYPLTNPTIQFGNAAPDITKLDPNAFSLLGSQVVLFGPDIFWDK
jgi:hypothetical protein